MMKIQRTLCFLDENKQKDIEQMQTFAREGQANDKEQALREIEINN